MSENTAKICEPGGSGLWLPIYSGEQKSSKAVRGIVYGFLLIYFFQGAATVSDYFMSAIETITSRKLLVFNEKTGRKVTVLAWNSTVANLTLMALGSSAPEILLSVIEVFSREFYSGDLGPSTIVGSAAFNLLIIISICICAIPSPEIRFIKETNVFYVTAVFSVLAYVWLLLIVQVITPEIIDIWEAFVTMLLFPLLVYLSFLADKNQLPICPRRAKDEQEDADEPEYAHGQVAHPRARSIIVKKMELEHNAAIEHEYREQKRGSIAPGRGSIVATPSTAAAERSGEPKMFSAKTIPLPPGEPNPVGDDGEVLRDLNGKLIECSAGVVTFCRDVQEVMAGPEETTAKIVVLRRNGSEGQILCRYHSEKDTAIPGYDYREATGLLVFEPEKMMNIIELTILPIRPKENDERFQLVLTDIEGGGIFNPNDDGGKDACVLTIIIKNDSSHDRSATFFERACDVDTMAFGLELWREQVRNAFVVETDGDDGDGDEEAEEEPNVLDYIFHFISLPWKLFYAVTAPPAIYAGGWLLFIVALAHIALLTSIICDLAAFFGCVLGIEDAVTAIVVVATGTSLPDLFASKSAALDDEYADASIVNVTGSNSVNVFLGIGIPWTVCSLYWEIAGPTDKWRRKYPEAAKEHPDGGFIVKAGTLVYTVAIFNSIAVSAICVLRLKRQLYGGELGGPFFVKMLSGGTLLALWATYVGLSCWKSASDDADIAQWFCMGIGVMFVTGCIVVDVGIKKGFIQPYVSPDDDGALKKEVTDPENVKVGLIDAAAKDAANENKEDESMAQSLGKSSDNNEPLASPTGEEDEEVGDNGDASEAPDGASKPKKRFKKGQSVSKGDSTPKKKIVKKSNSAKAEALKSGDEAYGQPAARGQPDQAADVAPPVEEDVIEPAPSPTEDAEPPAS